MQVGKMGIGADAAFDAMFAEGGTFGRPEGDFGDLSPEAAAPLYAARLEAAFAEAGYVDIEVDVNGAMIDLLAFTPDVSNVNLYLEVDADLRLEVVSAEGISVANGDRVDLADHGVLNGDRIADRAELARFMGHYLTW